MSVRAWTLLAAAFLVPGCTTTVVDGHERVGLEDDRFPSTAMTAKSVGDTVTYGNEGGRTHTVTVHRPPDDAAAFILDETLAPGQETSLTFDRQGTYHIFCRFHGAIGSGMHMNVTVAA